MIIKSMARHSVNSYGSLLSYITRDGKSKEGKPLLHTHNIRDKTDLKRIEREFIENEAFRRHPRANQVYVFHEVLSLSKHENTESVMHEMLHDLARKYIELRAHESLVAYAIHDDTDHKHVHFAISGVQYRTGMASRVSKDSFHDIKVTLQEYQEKTYGHILSFSSPEHGKGAEYLKDAEWYLKKRSERTLTKETIREKVAAAYAESKTQKEFLERLRDEHGLHHYERNGRMQGLVDEEGTKFRFSRLDIAFDELPVDVAEKTEEQQILDEIQALRAAREVKEREYEQERDEMDFSRYIHMNPNSLFE